MPRPNVFKRKYLVNKPMQVKYALLVGGALLLMLVLVEIQTFLMLKTILPNLFSSMVGKQVKALSTWLWVSGLVYLAFVAILSVVVSHRIAGPLFRLETDLKNALEGNDPSKRIALRKGDELHSLAALINRLLERLGKSRNG